MDANDSDLELIQRTKAGDAQAFDTLMRRYNRRVYQVIFGLTHNHADAEDLTQETFIRAFEHIRSFKEEYRFYTWLYRIAVNLTFTYLKRSRLGPQILEHEDCTALEVADDRMGAINEDCDRRRNIERALMSLPADQRLVLVLRTYEQLSYEEIARVTGTNIGTVMSRLFRARAKLRTALARYLEGR